MTHIVKCVELEASDECVYSNVQRHRSTSLKSYLRLIYYRIVNIRFTAHIISITQLSEYTTLQTSFCGHARDVCTHLECLD